MSTEAPVTFAKTGPGQAAFTDGLCSVLGFCATLDIGDTLAAGRPVLLHGWQPAFDKMIYAHPGRTWSAWHSGWAGSDLMGEGHSLAAALAHLRAGRWGLLWLERRDVLPTGAQHLAPVWSPRGLAALCPERPEKRPRSVVVGFHGAFASAAKNILASVAACVAAGARIEIAAHVLDPEAPILGHRVRAEALVEMLRGTEHRVLPTVERKEAVRVLAGAEVLVHASTAETWPYQPMEAVYNGTPVLLSEVVPWARELPPKIQGRCVLPSPKHTRLLAKQIGDLLASADLRASVLAAQRATLDRLAPVCAAEAAATLRGIGFAVGRPMWI